MFDFIKDVYLLISGKDSLDSREFMRGFEEKNARSVASRYSRGSIAIQAGAFLTVNDLERERKSLANYHFK